MKIDSRYNEAVVKKGSIERRPLTPEGLREEAPPGLLEKAEKALASETDPEKRRSLSADLTRMYEQRRTRTL